MSVEEEFAKIRHEEEMKALRLDNARLRQVISCATCQICGEEIADQIWTVDDDERLVHEACDKEERQTQD